MFPFGIDYTSTTAYTQCDTIQATVYIERGTSVPHFVFGGLLGIKLHIIYCRYEVLLVHYMFMANTHITIWCNSDLSSSRGIAVK